MFEASRSDFIPVYWLLFAVALIFLFSMGNHPFIPSMEPRFGEAMREMIANGQYLIPIKNGVAYIEYPPLYYWLAVAGSLAGLPDTYAVRLPAFCAFLLWLVWMVRLQKMLFPAWPAVLLPLLGATVPIVIYNFFIAQTDSLLTLGALIAFTGFARYRLRTTSTGFGWELWLGVTLAVAAKGPVGIVITLPAMALEIALAYVPMFSAVNANDYRWREAWKEVWGMGWLRGIGLILLFNAPWYIAAGVQQGWEFCRAILVYQNFTRFFEGYSHPQPLWYFGRTIWYDFFPLSLLLPFGLVMAWRQRREFNARMPMLWLLYTIVFFSISQSKQGKYLMPAAPALTVLALMPLMIPAVLNFHTEGIKAWFEKIRPRVCTGFVIWACGLLAVAAVLAILVLPRYAERIGGVGDFAQIRAVINARPGKLYTYQWPRAMMLYELGHPLPYFRSARDLYAALNSGALQADDYVLADQRYVLRATDTPNGESLVPTPQAPYLEMVLDLHQDQHVALYRVLPSAANAPLPATPEPYPVRWWERFDTD